jgi:hypothetical protein
MFEKLMQYIAEHYTDTCEQCERKLEKCIYVIPFELELKLNDIRNNEGFIGQIWYECQNCEHLWSHDFRTNDF